MPIYAFESITPVIDATAWIHPTASIIGDVVIGPGCFVGPGASLRGDIGRIILQPGCNVQDNCIVHCFPGKDVTIEEDGHIGHGAVLHGCIIKRNAMVGMNAVIMDDSVIGEDSFVAAMAFVKASTLVAPRTLVAGIPAKVMRELTDQEIAWKSEGTGHYQHLARRYLATAKVTEPMRAMTDKRDAQRVPDLLYKPKHEQ